MRDVFILGGARTPMAEYAGALRDVSALELGAIASHGALERSGVEPGWVDHVVFGNVMQTSADAIYGARHVALKAGLPISVPALTVNRLCGSGIQSAVTGAQHIQLGEADIVLAGGMESMSQAPHVVRGLRNGLKLGQGKLEDSLYEALLDPVCNLFMAQTAERCAAKYSISRDEQDRYALRSQQRAEEAWRIGFFAEEVVPVEVKGRKGSTFVDRDDHLRPDTTLEGLAKLPAAFSKDGTVTAGNASGIVDGGAAIVIASEDAVTRHGLTPLARLVSWAAVGVDPSLMGMGPAPAIRKAARADEPVARGHPPVRDQRGLCRSVSRRGEGAGAGSRARQRERRRHRAGPSARHERNPPPAHAEHGAAPARPEARHRVRLHRRRSGDRRPGGSGVGIAIGVVS